MNKTKKYYKLIAATIITAVLTVTGCVSTPQTNTNQENPTSQVTPDAKVTPATIVLQGNPTTGYTWQYSLRPGEIAQITQDIQYNGAPGVMGAGSTFTYTITPLQPGEANLEFSYSRPWEENSEIDHKTYLVNVDQNLNITVMELSLLF